jgi:tetratricopeptide (TPR) repeat protein
VHDTERPELLFRRARSLHLAGDDRRTEALDLARDALLLAGAPEPAAEAEAFLGHGAWYRGDRDAAVSHFSEALELVAEREASPSKARVLALSARFRMLAGTPPEAIQIAREALAIAETLELDELRAHALTTIGSSKSRLETSSGRPELEEAFAIGLAANSPVAATTLNNLGVLATWEGNFRKSYEIYPEAAKLAERFGDRDSMRFLRGNWAFAAYVVGRWDEAVDLADRFIAECASSPHYAEGIAREARSAVRLGRGDIEGAREDGAFILEHARKVKDAQRLLPTLASWAVNQFILGDEREARALATEALDLARAHVEIAAAAHDLLVVAGQLGIREEYREIAERAPEGPWKKLLLVGTAGDLRATADLLATFNMPSLEGLARLFGGELMIAEGRHTEGEAELEKALIFYRPLGATFHVERAERLLAKAQRASA